MLPLRFTFKKIALTNKLTVTDSTGEVLVFSEQKLLKLKEKIMLYRNAKKEEPLGEINADRVIDFSPIYTLTDTDGVVRTQIIRHGRQSIWTANYEITDENNKTLFRISEEKAWVKFWNGVLESVPFIGLLAGYFFNPTYIITDAAGTVIGKIVKKPALLESSYELLSEGGEQSTLTDQTNILSFGIVIIRERLRG